jgi:hypothetical protein
MNPDIPEEFLFVSVEIRVKEEVVHTRLTCLSRSRKNWDVSHGILTVADGESSGGPSSGESPPLSLPREVPSRDPSSGPGVGLP